MEWTFDITLKNRAIFKSFLERFSLEELNRIPEGYNNNIIWHIAHVIVTQQLLVYNLSGRPMLVTDEMVAMFRKGTRPERDLTQAEVDLIDGLLFSTIEKTKEDYNNGWFKTYNEYTVSTKNRLTNTRDAIEFNNYHEGTHLGYILALRKAI